MPESRPSSSVNDDNDSRRPVESVIERRRPRSVSVWSATFRSIASRRSMHLSQRWIPGSAPKCFICFRRFPQEEHFSRFALLFLSDRRPISAGTLDPLADPRSTPLSCPPTPSLLVLSGSGPPTLVPSAGSCFVATMEASNRDTPDDRRSRHAVALNLRRAPHTRAVHRRMSAQRGPRRSPRRGSRIDLGRSPRGRQPSRSPPSRFRPRGDSHTPIPS